MAFPYLNTTQTVSQTRPCPRRGVTVSRHTAPLDTVGASGWPPTLHIAVIDGGLISLPFQGHRLDDLHESRDQRRGVLDRVAVVLLAAAEAPDGVRATRALFQTVSER